MSFHQNLLYLCYISVLTIGLASAKLKRGYYPNLIDFCANDEVYVGIPWNCHGYLHCQNANGLKMPFWIDCPASLYYNYGSKTCTWPQNVSKPCPSTGGKYTYLDLPNMKTWPNVCAVREANYFGVKVYVELSLFSFEKWTGILLTSWM